LLHTNKNLLLFAPPKEKSKLKKQSARVSLRRGTPSYRFLKRGVGRESGSQVEHQHRSIWCCGVWFVFFFFFLMHTALSRKNKFGVVV
jgi:hypothetical protein